MSNDNQNNFNISIGGNVQSDQFAVGSDIQQQKTTHAQQLADLAQRTRTDQAKLTRMAEAFGQAFNASELKMLCFELGLNYDDLIGDNRPEKIISLLLYMHRQGELATLVQKFKMLRPNVPFDE